jgi:proteasome alpha subunit
MSTFYDFHNAIQQRNDYAEDQLRSGSPVVGVSCADGALLLTVRGTQRKCFDIYDRIAMGALGRQSDVESIRIAAIDSAHREGFQRSESDVSLQRLVGFGLSPAVKRIYNDQRSVPLVLRTLFAEVEHSPDTDRYFVLDYDGEFRQSHGAGAAAGTLAAENAAVESLRSASPQTVADALDAALVAWAIAWAHPRKSKATRAESDSDGTQEPEIEPHLASPAATLRHAFADGMEVEAVILERHSAREARFRPVDPGAVALAVAPYHAS